MMRNIPATDKDFLEWREDQPLLTHDLEVQQAMMVYVKWLNLKGRETYEQQKKVYEAYILSAKPVDAVPATEPAESLATSTTEDTPMNIPTLNPQNISSPASQNISNPNPQNSPAVGWIPAPLNLEPPLSSVPLNHL